LVGIPPVFAEQWGSDVLIAFIIGVDGEQGWKNVDGARCVVVDVTAKADDVGEAFAALVDPGPNISVVGTLLGI